MNMPSKKNVGLSLAAAALLTAGGMIGGPMSRAAEPDAGATVKPVLAQKLSNVLGKSLAAVVVTFAPGGKSPKHRHAGSVFAYVLSGAIRSENSAAGRGKVCNAGEGFFEPPGSEHLVNENASTTEPASLRAVFVHDDGAKLTNVDE